MTRNRKHKSNLIFRDETDKVYHDDLIRLGFTCRAAGEGELAPNGQKALRVYEKQKNTT